MGRCQYEQFLAGIADVRSDGRPDYRYHAHVLCADSVFPARVGVNGGIVGVTGTGFSTGLKASVGQSSAVVLGNSATQLTVAAPAHADGTQSIALVDPATGASSTMTGVLTYGAAPDDSIVVVGGTNPPHPLACRR